MSDPTGPSYEVRVSRSARRDLDRIPDRDYRRILQAMERLAGNPRPRASKKLLGFPAHRIRIGSYRVLYRIDDKTRLVLITSAGHRRDVYRR